MSAIGQWNLFPTFQKNFFFYISTTTTIFHTNTNLLYSSAVACPCVEIPEKCFWYDILPTALLSCSSKGWIICNWLYSIGTPKVFWHWIKKIESELEISDFYFVPKHFRCPNWVKSIAHDPALDLYMYTYIYNNYKSHSYMP